MMALPIPEKALDPRLSIRLDFNNVVDAHFLRLIVDEGFTTVQGDSWVTSVGADDAPGKTLSSVDYSWDGRIERLQALDGAVVHVVLTGLALHIRVAAVDRAACDAAIEQFRAAMPPDPGVEEQIPVSFWWWTLRGPEEMARMMPAPTWQELAVNYPASTRAALEPLVAMRSAPTSGGRLILWHGVPGSGKTTALRALAREWRGWAKFRFITDPEAFLANPSYLLSAIADRQSRSQASRSAARRWSVLVLEDSGEFLTPDAKQIAGQALSRLLNVCDGVLGQATNTLILVTTNDNLKTLHPAISRPGRCSAQVEFDELDAQEIAQWCVAHDIPPVGLRRATLADLYAHAEGRRAQTRPEGFGFAAA